MADERQEQKEFNDKVIAKIQEDPDFLGHLLEDPRGVLESAGLLQEPPDLSDDDAEGHALYLTHHRR